MNEPHRIPRFGEWWVRSESEDAHCIKGWEDAGAIRYKAMCGRDATAAVENGFRAEGIVFDCDRFEAEGACTDCLRHAFDHHADMDAHADCEIAAAKRRLGVPLQEW